MSEVCPVDFKNCPDDVCRGSGRCGRNGHDLLDRCDQCGQPVNEFIWCECEREEGTEDREDDEPDEGAA